MSERPLSPHLQIYRLPLTAVLSITHRITGVLLSVGLVFWAVCLMAVAEGEAQFAWIQAVLRSLPGQLLLWAWLFSLFFHFSHGVRHLIWDTGHGFDRDTLDRYAYLELVAAVLLTLGLFLLT
ncbi:MULTISPECIES: succinate dehydrogenase, cytochrome b556 subunit [Methylocaldum]|jgi:succinate dehydrogenase / fumarate reductase cytochrome b subunit|nr:MULTISPECIES: succinate dehydrogenase, cytochrome b556 subunit [unclassified Methylocaldum]MBP1151093.1 succinate dehydrogenase / fumarate reductase cytochrome b subunit [Methylocaldum sp. RMAD-M]MDV3243265.1 succinate dehydrogenase, cytochrome b556 subunit [Methylocaldum sp.]MVF22511.1 succinate dehydrogenase, cytochrome b556 subunit [Methylocaldum sp. BRCS4]